MKRHRTYISIFGWCLLAGTLCVTALSAQTPPADSADSVCNAAIYVVFAIDTEPARFSLWERSPEFNFATFDDAGRFSYIAAVMQSSWRDRYHDSRGRRPKFTWFVMSHEVFLRDDECGCTVVYDTLMKYAAGIEEFGDEIGWHYHHADWFDSNADGVPAWNQLTTFRGSPYPAGTDVEIAERALGCLVAKIGALPTAFRSGWVWENDRMSEWLDRIFPYDFSANPRNAERPSRPEPLRNVYDWSRAPEMYSGYHPHYSDYQREGSKRRWIFRTISVNTPHEWNRLFLAAQSGIPQVFCYTCHSFDKIGENIDRFLSDFLKAADSAHVAVFFATASEAGAARANVADPHSPTISMILRDSVISIDAGLGIFQPYPFCVWCTRGDNYRRIIPIPDGPHHWHLDIAGREIRNITCAVSSLSGKSASASLTLP